MPDYSEILRFLAANPPELVAEREMHASLLELLATCLRVESQVEGNELRIGPASPAAEGTLPFGAAPPANRDEILEEEEASVAVG
ncbi:MAG: hypothetical protein R3D33_08055 [Hyphomicrobiaceae bacterium]